MYERIICHCIKGICLQLCPVRTAFLLWIQKNMIKEVQGNEQAAWSHRHPGEVFALLVPSRWQQVKWKSTHLLTGATAGAKGLLLYPLLIQATFRFLVSKTQGVLQGYADGKTTYFKTVAYKNEENLNYILEWCSEHSDVRTGCFQNKFLRVWR